MYQTIRRQCTKLYGGNVPNCTAAIGVGGGGTLTKYPGKSRKPKSPYPGSYSLSKFSKVNSSKTTHFNRQANKKVHFVFIVYAPKHGQDMTEKNAKNVNRFCVLICLITINCLCFALTVLCDSLNVSLPHTQNTCLLSLQCTYLCNYAGGD